MTRKDREKGMVHFPNDHNGPEWSRSKQQPGTSGKSPTLGVGAQGSGLFLGALVGNGAAGMPSEDHLMDVHAAV